MYFIYYYPTKIYKNQEKTQIWTNGLAHEQGGYIFFMRLSSGKVTSISPPFVKTQDTSHLKI